MCHTDFVKTSASPCWQAPAAVHSILDAGWSKSYVADGLLKAFKLMRSCACEIDPGPVS